MLQRIAIVLAVLALLPIRGHALQDTALRLGQQCVAEISLSLRLEAPKAAREQQKIEECQLMWHILGAKVDYSAPALYKLVARYNSIWKRPGQRPWILALGPSLQPPQGWPGRLRWSNYAPRWQAMYEAAAAFVQRPGPHPCPEANHFGGRCDDTEHACDPPASCWVRQWCGKSHNWWSQAYWYRPGPCSPVIPAEEAAGGRLARR